MARAANLSPYWAYSTAILSEFSSVCDSHDLLPLSISPSEHSSVTEVLSALANGSSTPELDTTDDPSWADAISSPDREYWIAGAKDKLRSLEDLNIFVLVPCSEIPHGQRPLKGKLMCKQKQDDAGKVVRYKVCYVAKGYTQKYGVDFDETTAPTTCLQSVRMLLHIAALLGWDIQQYDIKTAFLNGILPPNETMYMEQPVGFEVDGKEDWVWKLLKSIYGMHQASQIWNKTFHEAVLGWSFTRLPGDWCIYMCQTQTGTVIFAVHINDIISIASTPAENNTFHDLLKSK